MVSHPKAEKANFSQLSLEAIDEALYSLGETVKTATCFHIDKTFKIKKRKSRSVFPSGQNVAQLLNEKGKQIGGLAHKEHYRT